MMRNMGAPTLDTLNDEGRFGSAYDHRVVVRMLGYLKPISLRRS